MNLKMPKLYEQAKIHKLGTPIRPLVSSIDSPAYNLSKWINGILRNVIKIKPKHGINNREELLNNYLKDFKLKDESKLVSFDVTNLRVYV